MWYNPQKYDSFKVDKSMKQIPDNMGIDNGDNGNNNNKNINNSLSTIAHSGRYLLEYWNGVRQNLQSYGCTILVAKVPPFATIQNRAKALDKFIISQLPHLRHQLKISESEPVKLNLIAHSMGGLDCRYLISKLKDKPSKEYKIVSLTTISTPHQGTSVANFAMNILPASLIKNQFPSIYQLTGKYTSEFNDLIRNDPHVKYFSYGAEMTPNPFSMFLITWKIIYDKEGPNDGMVSIKSSKWGEFVGYLEDVDHADLINWMGPVKKLKLAMGMPNFDPKYFYLDIVNNLANNNL